MDIGTSASSSENYNENMVDVPIYKKPAEIVCHDLLRRHLGFNVENLYAMIIAKKYIHVCRMTKKWHEDVNIDSLVSYLNTSSERLISIE